MPGLTWLALGLVALGPAGLAGGWSHRHRLAAVPRMTCDQLLRNGPGPGGVVTLTDVKVCRRSHAARRDADPWMVDRDRPGAAVRPPAARHLPHQS